MFIEMKKRGYEMRQRAIEQEKTRQKIVDAAVELHGTVGPGNTSISALADKAGVQRLTVYRHFPDEAAIFRSCSAHWIGQNPPPVISEWAPVENPEKRARKALGTVYAYYSRTAYMWKRVYRDREAVEALEEPIRQFEDYLDVIRDDLLAAWRTKGRKPAALKVSIGHALAFSTWVSLRKEGLTDPKAARLATLWISAAASKARAKQRYDKT